MTVIKSAASAGSFQLGFKFWFVRGLGVGLSLFFGRWVLEVNTLTTLTL